MRRRGNKHYLGFAKKDSPRFKIVQVLRQSLLCVYTSFCLGPWLPHLHKQTKHLKAANDSPWETTREKTNTNLYFCHDGTNSRSARRCRLRRHLSTFSTEHKTQQNMQLAEAKQSWRWLRLGSCNDPSWEPCMLLELHHFMIMLDHASESIGHTMIKRSQSTLKAIMN